MTLDFATSLSTFCLYGVSTPVSPSQILRGMPFDTLPVSSCTTDTHRATTPNQDLPASPAFDFCLSFTTRHYDKKAILLLSDDTTATTIWRCVPTQRLYIFFSTFCCIVNLPVPPPKKNPGKDDEESSLFSCDDRSTTRTHGERGVFVCVSRAMIRKLSHEGMGVLDDSMIPTEGMGRAWMRIAPVQDVC